MELFAWLERELAPTACTSEQLIYDDMDSQSGRSLPIIYRPFDAGLRMHWGERGAALDYVHATQAEGQRVLDLGPGDGWPTLIVAPHAAEVVGVEGSHRRVRVCRGNASRLGITNVSFEYVAPGSPLPFAEGSFDAAMAASSVEQTPDPRAALAELYRVLRPGGRLRIYYEALAGYRGGRERDTWLLALDGQSCRLLLYDRHIDEERVMQYGLTLALPAKQVRAALAAPSGDIPFAAVTVQRLQALRPALIDARVCATTHPSGATLAAWLREIGFRQVRPTHSGADLARRLFDLLPPAERPGTLAEVDSYLRPLVRAAIDLPAPLDADPMITALK